MDRVIGRTRAYFRAVKRGEVIFGPSLLLLLLLVFVVWVGYRPTPQEASGQEKAREATGPVAEPAQPVAPLFSDSTIPELPKDQPKAERPTAAIPGLSEMDVIGELQYIPNTNFRCPGAGPTRGLIKRGCTSSSDDDPPIVYEVTLLEDDPSTVLWVRADARDATDEAAAEFFSYVAKLSLEDTDPINTETWVGENISSGGGYSAKGAELKLYGTEGARTFEIVATGVPSDIVPEHSSQSRPKNQGR
jgi:hypothetical protein